ncbi:Hypothetical predicted protein [Lecanosticta acicola]|uniref:2EXR domain-containing protein n=1 Tax=Lecanosticta acicola TaxID=111012 RepID=A0AAI8YU73_9PEZI|nr:Hypothetical predicted protein [Lecanosticta acicola]
MHTPTPSNTTSNDTSADMCPFFELPAELRNRIYEYALYEPGEIWLERYCNHPRNRLSALAHPIRFPALLQTSKQVREEASGIWYSCARFYFDSLAVLGEFCRLSEPSHLKAVQTFTKARPWSSQMLAEAQNHNARGYIECSSRLKFAPNPFAGWSGATFEARFMSDGQIISTQRAVKFDSSNA